MYRQFVRSKLSAAFDGLNQGRIEAITDELANDAEHYFLGSHALSGTRHTPETIRRWYERLLRLLPDIHFDVQHMHVEGPPWRTLVAIEWAESNTGTDAIRTTNEGTNVLRIQWGKVTSVRIYTDTAVLIRTLDRLALSGVIEAHAEAIRS